MHEAGLIASVLQIVDESRQDNHLKWVKTVELQVGVMNGALPDALTFAFDAMRSSYAWLDDAAVLRIEMVPVHLQCLECHFEGPARDLMCPDCHSVLTRLVHGEEFAVVGYDGEDEEIL
ncbi:MAG: hydrogenase maturation nickel metallochaperone HypA [Sulfobacillus thermotolerans]|uniref:Hydrogenase maturation factor HypA n=1 Tax=Sulfobacillus thermotolerans TaxID=338644 RepID=A0ABN5H471_9FIRM|nr:hydrogenase nickel incorporation protein HypA [Sulfobacillus thermotolerans]MCY0909094.1 hydrogenase maturation nickel metallochaperone HypA [Sulfobacillus thermotolerans]